MQEEKSRARGLQEADAGPAGTLDPAQGPPCVVIIKTLTKVCTSSQHVLVSLSCPAGPGAISNWLSISEEVPCERMQWWFVAKILRGVNVGHDARETGFPTVCGKTGPSLRNPNTIHQGCLLQHAIDLIMVICLFHCMPGKGMQ